MPIIDIIIAVAIIISVAVGYLRGFVKEAVSVAALLAAIWAALYFGPRVGEISEAWLGSKGAQMWFGRILVFALVVSIGELIGWGFSRVVGMSGLKRMDRFFGVVFGAVRGVLVVALAVIGGQSGGFDNDDWWVQSNLIPRLEVVADWIKVMGPRGFEMLTPDEDLGSSPVDVASHLVINGKT
jgi:membrane protein required for colicin V production